MARLGGDGAEAGAASGAASGAEQSALAEAYLEPALDGETLELGGASDASGVDGGWWLDEPDAAKVRTAVLETWRRQDSAAKNREAREKRGELIRAGVRGVRVIEDDDQDRFVVRAPFGAESAPRAPNKADQLIRRIAATLTVDPPMAEVTPTADDDAERAAAELAERILRVEGAPSERDDVSLLRQMIDLAGTYASVFTLTYLDPQATLVPVEIQARPDALTVDEALVRVDPATGVESPVDPASLVTRYVRMDGTLTDVAAEAQLGWQPRVAEKLLRPTQVRFVPPVNVTGIEDAAGVLVGEVITLGECVARHYDGERPSEETCKQLVAWRPSNLDVSRWVPRAQRELLTSGAPTRPDGTLAEDALVVTLTLYLKSGPLAPHGAAIVIGGPREPLARRPWRETVGDGAAARVEHLPLPVVQLRWREDTATGDPYGIAGVDDLGPLEEVRAAMLKFVLDYAFRFGAPQVYLPFGTTVQPGQLQRRTGDPIYLAPEGQPFYEQMPPLTPVVSQVYDGMGKEMDTASGLEEAAQGVASSSVKSGAHARQIIEQALVALAGLQQNAAKAVCRLWSLRLTFMRAYYTAPRILRYLGEGGDYQAKMWTGMDLVGAGDIQIARGTGTMTPKSAKTMLAREDLQVAMQMGDQSAVQRYYRAIMGGTSPLLGLQDDPIRQRIARQVALWRQESKAQHPPPPPPPPMMPDPMTGQPVPSGPAMPDPVAQAAAQLFAPNPTDELPYVAPLRVQELADAMASRAFQQADPRYQQALYAEYERMRRAAGIQTLAEQQQGQQQQQQQQQAMQQAMQLEQIAAKNATVAAKTAYAESQGGPAAQRMAMQTAVEQQMRAGPPNPVNPAQGAPGAPGMQAPEPEGMA